MKSQWIEYQGKRILNIDLTNFKYDEGAVDRELLATVTNFSQEIYAQPLNSILVLVDIRGTVMSPQVQKRLTERISDTKKYVRKTAVIGMSGIRGIFLDYFARLAGSDTVGFDDPEAGKQWLVK